MTLVTYRDRRIDLKPYFEGFPYMNFMCIDILNQLYYFHRGEKVTLHRIPLTPQPDLSRGEKVSDLDFNLFSASGFQFDPEDGYAYFTGDEKNDEGFNIYRLDLATGDREKMTDEEYVYGKRLFRDDREIVFIARKKTPERMVSHLKVMDIDTGGVRTLAEDDPDWTFSWTTFIKHPKTGAIIFNLNYRNDRNQSNIMSFNPETGERKILLPRGVKRSMFTIYREMLDDDTILFISDESGYLNLYKLALSSGQVTPITQWTDAPVGTAELFPVDGRNLLFVTRDTPVRTGLFVLDPHTGETLHHEEINSKFGISTQEHIRLFAYEMSVNDPLTYWEIVPRWEDGRVSLEKIPFIQYPVELLSQIVHGKGEAVTYPTFDTDETTGDIRQIHAFVFVPDRMPENPAERRAVITAFYGGDNYFNKEYQIFLQAGFIVMSPAVRGSWGFGADFYSLNDRDLGGNEIIDLIYGARYLCRRFDLEEHQVGLSGGSHGGYCAMRGLTYPDGVNGHHEHFNFGFAISSFGISNIIDYYHTCNIPDWVLQKAGNPETEADMLNDRSPVYHAGKATGKLLLVHGENDNRVPVDQSRQMAAAMESAGKPYTYLEIPGQGHGWKGLNENVTYFRAVFDFLSNL
ncbi:MAG TPA: prolyl oligopeptidase family serine peptidase [bacterium]|nr:prolyl oligopeptidase family serine peptidase [bacterium]